MKHFLQEILRKARLFTIFDYFILKSTLLLFGIRLAIIRPAINAVNPWIYGALWMIGRAYLAWRMLRGGERHK